ncbi:hypothetical protein VOLCADRAFT_108352, partial [Volvox carteri f. nagariensis]
MSTSKANALASLKARRQQAASTSTPETGASPGTRTGLIASDESKSSVPNLPEAAEPAPGPSVAAETAPPSAAPPGPSPPLPTRQVEAFAWVCGTCQRECVPVRSESRCLCGHRLREHDPASSQAASRCGACSTKPTQRSTVHSLHGDCASVLCCSFLVQIWWRLNTSQLAPNLVEE